MVLLEPSEAIRQTPVVQQPKTFSGKPCKKCSATERYRSDKSCVTCRRAYYKARGSKETYRRRRSVFDGIEFVYRCFSSTGELLYIGRTNHPSNRINTHKSETPWWGEVARMVWVQVPDVERRLIVQEQPKYNKHR